MDSLNLKRNHGLIFFIIPGIIIGVWYGFAIYIVVTKDIGIFDAFRESREFARGRFMGILGRFIVIILVTIIISIFLSIIPFIGTLVATLAQPLFVMFLFLLYKDLVRVKGSQSSAPAKSS